MLVNPGTGLAKLGDFGSTSSSLLAAQQSQRVTLGYRAPDIATGGVRYGQGVDLWALGVTLFEVLKVRSQQLIAAGNKGKGRRAQSVTVGP